MRKPYGLSYWRAAGGRQLTCFSDRGPYGPIPLAKVTAALIRFYPEMRG